mgnify:FL=1
MTSFRLHFYDHFRFYTWWQGIKIGYSPRLIKRVNSGTRLTYATTPNKRHGSFGTRKLGLVSVTSIRGTLKGQYDPPVQLLEPHTLWNKEANTQPLLLNINSHFPVVQAV